ncbi:MAG: hypothetical protein LKK12_09670 [Bacteroidales bacterium]|nr:hypothetical protein [Bacteroidales bacterium]
MRRTIKFNHYDARISDTARAAIREPHDGQLIQKSLRPVARWDTDKAAAQGADPRADDQGNQVPSH